MVRTYNTKRNLRYYIEDFLGARIHFFEDGFKKIHKVENG